MLPLTSLAQAFEQADPTQDHLPEGSGSDVRIHARIGSASRHVRAMNVMACLATGLSGAAPPRHIRQRSYGPQITSSSGEFPLASRPLDDAWNDCSAMAARSVCRVFRRISASMDSNRMATPRRTQKGVRRQSAIVSILAISEQDLEAASASSTSNFTH
jgi:hypothetical protein